MITKQNAEALFEPDVISGIIEGTVKRSVAMQIMNRLPDMTSNKTKMRVTDALPMAYWVNNKVKNGRKNITQMAWDNKFITAAELAVIVPIKQDVLDDAEYDIWASVEPRIEEAFAKKFDEAVFTGVDRPDEFRADLLTSINEVGAFVTQGASETLYSAINNAMAKVEESDYNPNAILGGVSLKSKFRMMLDTTGQPLNTTEIGSLARHYVSNGAWDKTKALLIVGDFSQAVYSIRQDITYKVLDQAVIQDPSTGDILYNLAQEDMVALRCVMRLGWEIPNPINAEQPDESVRFPFAAIKGTSGITTYKATITVTDDATTAKNIEGAKVTIGGLVKKTGAAGKAEFDLTNGTYDVTITAKDKEPVNTTLTVNSAAVAKTYVLTAR